MLFILSNYNSNTPLTSVIMAKWTLLECMQLMHVQICMILIEKNVVKNKKKNELTVQCCRFWIVMACPFQLAVAGLTLPYHHGFWFRLVCSKNQILQLVLLKRYKSMFFISEFWRFRDNYLFSMMSLHWHFELISEFAREYIYLYFS